MRTLAVHHHVKPAWLLAVLVASCISVNPARGETAVRTFVSIVGDEDALGTRTVLGGNLPPGPFDNRSVSELLATDGSENTDFATGSGGVARDATFIHTFPIAGWRGVGPAILELGIGGMQSNDNNWNTARREEDALRIDGVLLYNVLAGIDQGPRGYGMVRIVLPAYFVSALFEDGQLHVSIDLNSFAGTGNSALAELVFYDFSRLTISEIPEPSTALLLLSGVGVLVSRTQRRANPS